MQDRGADVTNEITRRIFNAMW